MEIIVEIKNNYGVQVIYPVSDEAKLFARVANTRTLTRETIGYIKQLGYEIKVQVPESII